MSPDIRTREFGWTGIDVPVVGQGTWQLRDKGKATEALQLGIELGMTHIDTAELYTGSEEVVGRAIKNRRDDIFLVSKVLPHNASYQGTIDACNTSLKKLGTDHLDVYLLHWRTGEHGLEDTFRAMGDLIDDGAIRYLGVSNFGVADLEEAESVLGDRRIACNQVRHHLMDRGMEADVLPWCQERDVAVVGYSPYGTGHFPRAASEGGQMLGEIAGELGKTPRQVALAFLTYHDGVFTIPKAETLDHVRENAGGGFVLPKDAYERLDAAFPI